MKVFLAGATGVIGRRLVPQLLAAGHEVTGMTRSPARAAALEQQGARAAVADALDADSVRAAVVGAAPEAVIHQLTSIPARRAIVEPMSTQYSHLLSVAAFSSASTFSRSGTLSSLAVTSSSMP